MRPTIGEDSRRSTPAAPATTPSRRQTPIALASSASETLTDSAAIASRVSSRVTSAMKISPAAAARATRAATLEAPPIAGEANPMPATTWPVLTPMRTSMRTPKSRSSPSVNTATASRSSVAARTALKASSSCTCGRPNTAMNSISLDQWIEPPCRSITLEGRRRDARRSHSRPPDRSSPSGWA